MVGGMIWIWFFASQHIGVSPAPVAGVPFYLHAHTAVIAPRRRHRERARDHRPGRRRSAVAVCAECGHADALQPQPVRPGAVDRRSLPRCQPGKRQLRRELTGSTGSRVRPGHRVPVVVDSPTSGTAAMTAMWATTDVGLSNNNVLATVPVTVAANPNPPTRPRTRPTHDPTVARNYRRSCGRRRRFTRQRRRSARFTNPRSSSRRRGVQTRRQSTGTP